MKRATCHVAPGGRLAGSGENSHGGPDASKSVISVFDGNGRVPSVEGAFHFTEEGQGFGCGGASSDLDQADLVHDLFELRGDFGFCAHMGFGFRLWRFSVAFRGDTRSVFTICPELRASFSSLGCLKVECDFPVDGFKGALDQCGLPFIQVEFPGGEVTNQLGGESFCVDVDIELHRFFGVRCFWLLSSPATEANRAAIFFPRGWRFFFIGTNSLLAPRVKCQSKKILPEVPGEKIRPRFVPADVGKTVTKNTERSKTGLRRNSASMQSRSTKPIRHCAGGRSAWMNGRAA